MVKDFLELTDMEKETASGVVGRALEHKEDDLEFEFFEGETLGLLFENPSTRTRVSFEVAIKHLGGDSVFLDGKTTQISRGESLKDTARVLSKYIDALVVRTSSHEELETIAEYSEIPVINGLTDKAHPCQALADMMTIREIFEDLSEVKAAWVGPHNNVCHSFVKACSLFDVNVSVAAPDLDETLENAGYFDDPLEAVKNADIVYTDVWVSMHENSSKKVEGFNRYQVNEKLLENSSNAYVMHCLPAKRGEEITGKVLEGDSSIVWRQAENRLHLQKALLEEILAD